VRGQCSRLEDEEVQQQRAESDECNEGRKKARRRSQSDSAKSFGKDNSIPTHTPAVAGLDEQAAGLELRDLVRPQAAPCAGPPHHQWSLALEFKEIRIVGRKGSGLRN
jgi:hypothetical protein